MPRTIQEIFDQQEELADKFENFDPELGHERPIEEYLEARRLRAGRQEPDSNERRICRYRQPLTGFRRFRSVSSGCARALCVALLLVTVSGARVEAKLACRRPSPITGKPMRVVEARSRNGPVRGLLFLTNSLPIKVGQEVKIIWHIEGRGDLRIAYFAPDGKPRKLVFGPTAHEGTALSGPGEEFGAGFRFDSTGCWRINLVRGEESARAWISVN